MNPINAITDPKSQLAVMRTMGTAIDLGIGQKAAGGQGIDLQAKGRSMWSFSYSPELIERR